MEKVEKLLLSPEEVAELLGISVKTIYSRVSRKSKRPFPSNMLSFFDTLWGDSPPGWVNLFSIRKNKQKNNEEKVSLWVPADKIHSQLDAIKKRIDARNVYFGVTLQRGRGAKYERSTIQNSLALPCLFHDTDIAGPGHKETSLPKTLEEAVTLIKTFPLQPSLAIHSGGGVYPLWIFHEP